jgi:diguanylate cyclase (GGDEF)-like protein/PAS domain S-box-containing protein/putative nucleotidyltransferase with HDIG domain
MPLGYALHKIVLNEDGRPFDLEFIEVNPKFEETTGLKSAEVIGRRMSDLLPGTWESGSDWISSCLEAALNDMPHEMEQHFKERGRWLRINAYSPETNLLITLLYDITAQKTADIANTEKAKKLTAYLDSIPLGIVVVDSSGRLMEVNAEACRIAGYEEPELVNRNLQRLVASGSRIFALMFFKELLGAGQAESQLQIKTKAGEFCWLSVIARRLSADSYILYCQDITSYKNMEDDLVESELLYRTFIDASDNMIYLKDENLKYKIVNDALLDQFGCEISEIIGKTDGDALPEAFSAQTSKSDIEAIQTKASCVSEITVDRKVFEAVKFPVSIGKRKTGVGAYIRDITEEKHQEEILKRTMERHRILANALMMTFHSGQEQLDYALQEALALTGSQFGCIFTYDDINRELTLSQWTDTIPCADLHTGGSIVCPLELTGIWGEAIRSRSPVIINKYSMAKSLRNEALLGNVPIRKFMSIPVILNDRIVAAVGLANKQTDYDEYDIDELTMLINGVWVAAEKKNVQTRMENLLEQTQAMFNEHDAVMLLIEPDTGRIIDANPAAVTFYGYSKDELLELYISDINVKSDEVVPAGSDIPNEKHRFFSTPHRLKNGDKRIVDVYACPITYNNEKVLFSIIFDVTEREEAFDEIKYLSFHDHLTGLYNRRYFDNVLKLMNDEKFMPLTIVMADVNGLKLINDSFGHTEGDELLTKAAELIVEGCRKEDISARIGGDEFVIILPNTDSNEAEKIIRRIKKAQSKINIRQLELSMSFGFAVKYDVESDIELIVSEAENNMYRSKSHESASTRNKTVSIIMKTLYEKCIGEVAHSKRVSKLSAAIAAELGLTPEKINQISIAGLLHDIGKIGVDDTILNKPGIFTSADRAEIQRHPESGWRILSNSDEYAGLADYILYHHEKVDGKGYPRGIKGDNIPLVSKIIAVSDAYDAMTNDRPYRKAKTREEAVEELRKHAGTQFDAVVVGVFIERVLSADAYADIIAQVDLQQEF